MTTLAETIGRYRLVPVVVLDDPADAPALAEGLMAGGLPIAEVTLRTPAAVACIRALARIPGLLVGAGTVTNAAQVDEARDAGARFIVSPGTSPVVLRRCAERLLPAIPGVATATEIMLARDEGARVVKFFPAQSSGGLAALDALAAPFPDVRFVPTGGIGPGNAQEYLRHPAVLAVGGSWMVARAAIGRRDVAGIARLSREAVALAAASSSPEI